MMELVEKGHYGGRDHTRAELSQISQPIKEPGVDAGQAGESSLDNKSTMGTSNPLTSGGVSQQLKPKTYGTTKAGKKKGPKFGGMRMKVNKRLNRGTDEIDTDLLIENLKYQWNDLQEILKALPV